MESASYQFDLQSLVRHLTVTEVAVLILGLFVLWQFFLVIHSLFLDPLRDVPGPFLARFTRLWELRHALAGDMPETLIELHEKYGPVVRTAPNMYSFSQADDCKAIYSTTESKSFTKTSFYHTSGDPAMPNIFNMKDEKLHSQRKRKIAGLYNMSTMVHYEESVNEMNSILLRKLEQYAEVGKEMNLPAFMQYYAFDVIGKITVDKEFGMMETEGDVDDFINLTRQAILYMASVGLFPELHPMFLFWNKIKGVRHAGTVLVSIARESVKKAFLDGEDHQADSIKSDPFHSKLARLLRSEQINSVEATDSIASNIAAGSDTTAITLGAAFYYLYNNPEILKKLRTEVDSRSDPVTFEETQTMPYLQAIINETLRMHPAVGFPLRREVQEEGSLLAGRHFPKGTHVGVSGWVLHQNKAISGPDASIFRPERWLEDASKGNTKTSMSFAFGGGTRICLGKNISLLEMNKVIPQVVRKFDIVFGEDPWDLKCHWFVWPQYKVRIQKRHMG